MSLLIQKRWYSVKHKKRRQRNLVRRGWTMIVARMIAARLLGSWASPDDPSADTELPVVPASCELARFAAMSDRTRVLHR